MISGYDPEQITRHFDEYAEREWSRLVATPVDEVSLYIHAYYLQQHIRPRWRVLEIGAGAGRFTQILAQIGTQILVADISPVQLELNRRLAAELGFANAVEAWQEMDICNLSQLADESFDAVVAYGGPLSYVLDRRDLALQECLRVLKPGGLLLLSVMSLWGTVHRHLRGVLDIAPETNARIVASGDLSPQTMPRGGNYMHLFRSSELQAWLNGAGLEMLGISASYCLSPVWDEALKEVRPDARRWEAFLDMEREASANPGCLDMGTHIICVMKKI
ncbi:MAG: methyltransferase domain-containing protein [Anaerolineales bacterium]|nr:methyltransferase domain-containing protein [Anaerolineales bacterium]